MSKCMWFPLLQAHAAGQMTGDTTETCLFLTGQRALPRDRGCWKEEAGAVLWCYCAAGWGQVWVCQAWWHSWAVWALMTGSSLPPMANPLSHQVWNSWFPLSLSLTRAKPAPSKLGHGQGIKDTQGAPQFLPHTFTLEAEAFNFNGCMTSTGK